MRTGTTLSYLLSDDLGSSTIALSSTGSVVAVQLFAPFGSSRYSLGTMPTTYNFTGQRLDSETGLLYYGARYYDPFSARFIQADSVQNNAGGMDPYAYVGENPETRTDPTGKYFAPPGGSNNGYPPPRPTPPPTGGSSTQPTNYCNIYDCSVTLNHATYSLAGIMSNLTQRRKFLTNFYNQFASGFGKAELDFFDYLFNSGRLDEQGGYWDNVDYLLAKDELLAAFDQLNHHAAQNAVVNHWLAFLAHPTNNGWWIAHNGSINTGDEQARADGVYGKESGVEQVFINETIHVINDIQYVSQGDANPLSSWLGPQSSATGVLASIFYPHQNNDWITGASLVGQGVVAGIAGGVIGGSAGALIASGPGAIAGGILGIASGDFVFQTLLAPTS